MRLTEKERVFIKEIFLETFQDGKIYLFGSRTDDAEKGGDIDLFVQSDSNNPLEKKIQFLSRLKQKIGDQKIDLIIARDSNRLIEQEALTKGIEL
ncbi:nucleotidyltransferase domain-containing protein [Sulfurimonas sediminis]|uniref:Nucleotidyltransferase domain-containing protein n=1 Tax=Sulfurimonas sediminis TaxID=2590020 RepID=A0A7M1AZ45_9BACT|nr:nucleotidyltransferase domain-containing protein [Sulfurimonas sediminis]QOP42645.1 nucleotidyltransferase domain-containing protein [Sulfurimonas sediminis]